MLAAATTELPHIGLITDNAHYREVAFAELVAHRIQVRSPAANNDAGVSYGVTFCLHRKPILSSVEHIVGILLAMFTVSQNTANEIDIINERHLPLVCIIACCLRDLVV